MNASKFYAGLFLTAGTTLMLQLIQTRILSVVAWYHLAFFVISTAMFGLTVGAVWVYLRRERFSAHTLSADLAHYGMAYALSTAVALGLQMTLVPVARPSLVALLIWFELALLMALPFFFAGVVVTLALTRSPFPVGRVYGVDLIGAALGCFGVVALLNLSDGPTAILWTSVIAAFAALLFSGSGIGGEPERRPTLGGLLGRRKTILACLALVALVNGLDSRQMGLRPLYAKGIIELTNSAPWFENWNSFSRVVASQPFNRPPFMWGPSPLYKPQGTMRQSQLNIDGDAGTTTYDIGGDIAKAQFLREDVTTLAYNLDGIEKSAVIGVGGGRDVLSAKVFGVPNVTGVEINPTFIELLTEEPAFRDMMGLYRMPGVKLEIDEARSWFARSTEHFDLIQMSLIDTWAATGAGAFSLSENGLYTLEGWSIFLDRLTERGVYTVSRWYNETDVTEIGRMLSLAVGATLQQGATEPSRHIFIAHNLNLATLVLSRSPLSEEQLARLRNAAQTKGFGILIDPDRDPENPILRSIIKATDLAGLFAATQGQTLDMTPPRDDRPFFFNQLPVATAVKSLLTDRAALESGIRKGNLFATLTLIMLFAISLVLVIAAIIIPLRPALRDVGGRVVTGGTAYFILIGFGFMVSEIALLQRFSVFLGHPIYSLIIVLSALILSTGLGSLLSDRLSLNRPATFAGWALITAAYLGTQSLWVPDLLLDLDSASLMVRAL
ncbi:MAG: hypothetical protein ACPGNT_05355, partial [Rhodospirillales bacterium]